MHQALLSIPVLLYLGTATTLAADEALPRQVSVSGTASLTATPDRASISLGIQARNRSLTAARNRVASVAEDFLVLTRKLGIAEKEIQTTGLTMRPEYRWNQDRREQEFVGYFVQRSLTVQLEDLELLGKLIEGAVDAGVNEVSPPRLDSSRRPELHREALALAAADARANAEVLARSLDANLGTVRQISASNAPPRPMATGGRVMMAEAADATATYQTGDIRFEARVNAIFDLE